MDHKLFSLSANIDEGLTPEMEAAYIVTPNVRKVAREIVSGYQAGIHCFTIVGTYGTGKSSFLLAFARDLTGMKEHQPRLLPVRSGIYEGPCEVLTIVGDARPLSDLLRQRLIKAGVADTGDALEMLRAYYDKLHKEGRFLLLLIDEMGKVLEHAAVHNPEEELYFIQKLCEYIAPHTRRVLLLTTLHQHFSAYARDLSTEQRNEWNKVRGRLQEVVFAEPVEQLLYLAARHLERHHPDTREGESCQRLRALAVRTGYVTPDFSEELSECLWPLDAFSATAVTRAIQRYGQNERSLFSFLYARGERSLAAYQPAEHRSYNLAAVYDYLISSFRSYLENGAGDSARWAALTMAIERVEHAQWSDERQMMEAVSIVKSVGLLNLLGDAGFRLNSDDMAIYARLSLDIRDAPTLINRLIAIQILRYAVYKDRLVLFEGTDICIEDEMTHAALVVPRPTQFLEDLRHHLSHHVVAVTAAYYQSGTPRYFEYKLLETPRLLTPEGDTDGFVELIFPADDEEHDIVKTMSANCEEAIVYVIWNDTGSLIDRLHQIQKYRYVIAKVKAEGGDHVALRELERLISYEQAVLERSLSEGMFANEGKVTWIYKGQEQTIRSQRDFNHLLSRICSEVYPLAPVIQSELCNRHKLSGSISTARVKYLQALLDHGEESWLGFADDKFPPEKTIYHTLLRATGLHRSDGSWADRPTDTGFLPLWDACETFLASTRDKPRKLTELIRILTARPYKVKEGLLDFWIPTYLYIKRLDYSLYGDGGRYVPSLTMEIFDLMRKHMADFSVKAFATEGVKLQLFNDYRRFLHLEANEEIKGASLIETIRPFLFFYSQRLNDYARQTRKLPHETTLRFRQVLATAKDPERAFLDDMPRALGYDDTMLSDGAQARDYCELIQQAVRELRDCYPRLIDRLEETLVSRLGLHSCDYDTYIVEIRKRLSSVKPHLLPTRQRDFYSHALTVFTNRTEWYQSISFAALGKPLDRLHDDEEPKLHDDLVYLMRECERQAIVSAQLDYTVTADQVERSARLEKQLDEILTGDTNLDTYTLTRMLQKLLNK